MNDRQRKEVRWRTHLDKQSDVNTKHAIATTRSTFTTRNADTAAKNARSTAVGPTSSGTRQETTVKMTIGAVNARVAGYVEIRLSAARHTRQTVAAHSHPLRMAVDFVNGATAVIDLGYAVGTTGGVERARLTLQLRTHNLWCCCTHTRWHITFVTALALRRRQRAFAITRFVFSFFFLRFLFLQKESIMFVV